MYWPLCKTHQCEQTFSDDVPCRVVLCLIKNDQKLGNYQNPYEFRRFWDVPKVGFNFVHLNREQFLEEKLNHLEKTLKLVLEGRQTELSNKGKGRGKRSSGTSSFFGRFRSTAANEPSTSSGSCDVENEEDPPPYDDIETETKRIYVKKIELLLNGTPLGKLTQMRLFCILLILRS